MKKTNLTTLGLWLGLVILAGYQVLVNTVIHSDMTVFMPKMSDNRFGLLTRSASDSPAARIWFLALEGASPAKLAHISKELTRALRDSGRFNSVLNGENILSDADEAFLFKYRYILDPNITDQSFSVATIKYELKERLTELGSPLSAFLKKWLSSDPTAIFLRLAQNMAGQSRSLDYFDNVWMTKEHNQAMIIAESKAAGLDLDAQSSIKEYMSSELTLITDDKNIKLLFGGAPNIAIQSRDKIKSESQRLSFVAAVFMLGFLFWIYRSAKRVVLTAFPLAVSILFATAAVSYLFNGIHGITLAFGITVLGVAVDYPIHVLSHAHKGETFSRTIDRIWPTLRLGVITTLLGYAAMAITDYPGLAQFGVFSIVGLLTAAFMTRSLFSGLDFTAVETPRLYHTTGKLNLKPGPFIISVLTILFLLVLINMSRIDVYWSEDLAELSPIPKQVIIQDRKMRQLLSVDQPRYLVMVEAEDLESLLLREEAIMPVFQQAIKDDTLQAVQMAAQILPSKQRQKMRKALLPDKEMLTNNLNEALQGLPFKSNIFKPFVDDIGDTKTMPALTYQQLQQSGFGSRLESLVSQTDMGFTGMIRLIGIKQPEMLAQRLEQAAVPGVYFMDIKQSSNDLVNQFRQEALSRIAWAAGLMALVLVIALRDIPRIVRVLVPVVCAVVVASAVTLALGDKLNIFHLMSLLLVAGISLDYGLFFSCPSETVNKHQTLHALSVCAISTVTIFGVLATATIPVLHAIGLTVAVGVFTAFILSWTFSRKISTVKITASET